MVAAVIASWVAVALVVIIAWPRLVAERSARMIALVLISGLSLVHQLMFDMLAEDAFITFRYAENVAEGHGPVFNIGEPVEGYTNFLLLGLLSVLKAGFGADVVLSARVLGVLSTIGCVVAAYFLARKLSGRSAAGVLAAALTATVSNLAAYGASGLETSLFALLVLGMLLAACYEHWVIGGLLLAMAVLTRPDGVVVGAVLLGWLIVRVLRQRANWWQVTAFVLASLVVLMPWTAWRALYYGHFLPNPLVAKQGGEFSWQLGQGWEYLGGYLLAVPALLLLALAGMVLVVLRRAVDTETLRAQYWLVVTLCVVFAGFVVLVGGDWMPAWRLLAPLGPVLAAGAASGLILLSKVDTPAPANRVAPALVIVACAFSLVASIWQNGMLSAVREWRAQVDQLGEIGSWLGEELPRGTVISTYANGALSYRAGNGLPVVDQLGLTDEYLAREVEPEQTGGRGSLAFDFEYIVDTRRPSVVIPTQSGYDTRKNCSIATEFRGDYIPKAFRVADSDDWVTVYLRGTEASQLTGQLAASDKFTPARCP
ncbi:dolichyl-phosphate-mannose-protein mannosyltransferase [Tamaricihabitans halophyticus]|uniref:Dolichyl-phosphate-mannose-protein mannosyltransferase n=1 Tax=Tamaricihabitans halophyticus TaxID=1262583 RepID=A0A4R2R4T8_9PSEU|nr:glycosyltransferase family 39 protein [Tamaricihabitans halophyticus]TCP57027.1 dolichyl-phosphate-mannose-protein mannosyltransferase [Tamaricihabitans halophyticus]